MPIKVFLVLLLVISFVNSSNEIDWRNEPINSSFLESALDAQECDRQIGAIRSNPLLFLQFSDAGFRTPRGILTGNVVDMGNYHQCLQINQRLADMHIEGRYCSIRVHFNQSFHLLLPQHMQTQFDPTFLVQLDNETISKMEEYDLNRKIIQALSGDLSGLEHTSRSMASDTLSGTVFRLAICIPKPCTTEQAISSLFFNISEIGFRYTDDYCRLPGDKTWVAADYVAVVVFAVLGFVTLVSTSYDLSYRFLFKKDVKQMSVLGRSFSVYTNGQRLTTFSTSAGTLQCLDGIRTLAMLWVIIVHSFGTEPFIANPAESFTWRTSASALWITSAGATVDTFFVMAGILLVYTTAGKFNQINFLKNLHWFYLTRYVRITPLLAVTVLLQTSYYNRFTDGPHWTTVVQNTRLCRENWWSTLLHVQNFVHVDNMCVPHSWYVAIDFQLYIVSPLILIWVFSGKKLLAWMGLIGGLAAVLIASTIYCFNLNLPAAILVPSRIQDMTEYFRLYYFNTLCRASPFFVGLVFGYILHIHRKKKMQMSWYIAVFFWACFAGILSGYFYFIYSVKDMNWDNQLVDNLINSFMRPIWACAISWLIIACTHGYGGPVNWFLCLDAWRLPARLSYGMFLFHYPFMYTFNATMIAPIYFSVENFTFKFAAHFVVAMVYAFILTLLVDSPITVLYKLLMDSMKPKKKPAVTENAAKENDSQKNGISNNYDKNISKMHATLNEDKVKNDGDDKNISSEHTNANKDNEKIDGVNTESNNIDIEASKIKEESDSNDIIVEKENDKIHSVDTKTNDEEASEIEEKPDLKDIVVDPNTDRIDSNSGNVVTINDSGNHVNSESVPDVK